MVSEPSKILSKAVFGNAYWLAIGAVIAETPDGTFTQRSVANQLNIADNLVRPTIKRLSEAGFIQQRGRHWERSPSPLWAFLRGLHHDVEHQAPPDAIETP